MRIIKKLNFHLKVLLQKLMIKNNKKNIIPQVKSIHKRNKGIFLLGVKCHINHNLLLKKNIFHKYKKTLKKEINN
jgi:hypothetical protein